jgi:hypothetical protein
MFEPENEDDWSLDLAARILFWERGLTPQAAYRPRSAHETARSDLDSTTLRPRRGGTVFAQALQTGNLVVAEGMARELGQISLAEALELTALVGRMGTDRLSTLSQ